MEGLLTDLEAIVGTYELRSYGAEKGGPLPIKNYVIFSIFQVDIGVQ